MNKLIRLFEEKKATLDKAYNERKKEEGGMVPDWERGVYEGRVDILGEVVAVLKGEG